MGGSTGMEKISLIMKRIKNIKRHYRPSFLLLSTLLVAGCTQTNIRQSHQTNDFDLYKFSHGEEPYLSMTRTVQLLSMLQIRGWSISHIKSGEYNVYIQSNGKWEFLDGRSIDKSKAEYLFLQYAQKGDSIVLYSMSNSGSSSVGMKSHFTSAGKYRTEPIPAVNGTYTLVETYDKTGKIIIKLSGIDDN